MIRERTVKFHQVVGKKYPVSDLDGQLMRIDDLGVDTEPEKEKFVRGLHQMAIGKEYVSFTVAQLLDASEVLGIEYEDEARKRLEAIKGDAIEVPATDLLNLSVIRAQVYIARTAYTMLDLGVSRDG